MTHQGRPVSLEHPLITDLMTSGVSAVFAIGSLCTVRRATISVLSFDIDRGIWISVLFLCGAAIPWIVPRLIGRTKRRLIRWFRIFYIQIYYLFFFSEAIHISFLLYRGHSFDSLFARLDLSLFGMQPSLELYRVFPESPIIVELFFFSYGSFYLLFTVFVWILFFRGREKDAYEFLTIVTIGYYALNFVYLVFPVAGPKYFFEELRTQWYEPFRGYLFTNLMKRTFDSMDLYGAAFPSSHAAISILAFMLNCKYQRAVAFISLPFTVLLLVATVYIYAHYAVDTIAGVAVGIAFFLAFPRCVEKLHASEERRRHCRGLPRSRRSK